MRMNELMRRLEQAGAEQHLLPVSRQFSVLTARRGGRILGIYENGKDENLLWTAPQLEKDEEAESFLKSELWNVGGDRLWFGPEIRYSVGDREHFWQTLHTPETIDPGAWEMSRDGQEMQQKVTIAPRDGTAGEAEFSVRKSISPCEDPLRNLPDGQELRKGVDFGGFHQTVSVSGQGTCVEPWSLLQVMPGGKIYIPMYTPEAGTDYYEPAAAFETVQEHCAVLEATGCNRYKVGYHAAAVTGRLGYTCRWNGRYCLLIRSFPNDPSGLYEEEPPLRPGVKGFSVHVYNDGGPENGFAEIECSLPALFGSGGRTCAADTISTWIYTGEKNQLQQIGNRLLGCRIEF